MFLRISHTVPERSHLLAVRDLLHIAQIDSLLIDHDRLSSHRLHLDSFIIPESFSCSRTTAEVRFLRRLLRAADHREALCLRFRISGDILRHVAVHLDNGIGNVEISSRTSRYDYSGNAIVVIQLPYPLDKRSDRLHVAVNDSLHQLIADHEVGSTCILVDQEKGSSRLDTLYYISRLRSTAAGVLCTESHGVFPVRKIIDKHGNIRFLNAPAVLSAQLHGGIVRDDVLSAVSRDMIVYPQLQRF